MVYLPVLTCAHFALWMVLEVYLIKYFIILLHNYIYTGANYHTSVYTYGKQEESKEKIKYHKSTWDIYYNSML